MFEQYLAAWRMSGTSLLAHYRGHYAYSDLGRIDLNSGNGVASPAAGNDRGRCIRYALPTNQPLANNLILHMGEVAVSYCY